MSLIPRPSGGVDCAEERESVRARRPHGGAGDGQLLAGCVSYVEGLIGELDAPDVGMVDGLVGNVQPGDGVVGPEFDEWRALAQQLKAGFTT